MSKTKDIISDFVGFVKNYGDEALATADALTSVLSGLALPRSEAEKVHNAINALRNAAENISKAKAPTKIVIKKSDIEAAVASTLPSILNDVVTKAVTEALAKELASDETPSS